MKKLSELQETELENRIRKTVHKQNEKFKKEIIKKNQINFEADEHNDKTEKFNRELQSRHSQTEERISKLKATSFEIIQSEEEIEKKWESTYAI